jgi:methionyl-tRNA formyltransferase
MPLTIVFMGTPDFSVPTLMEIAAAGHRIAAVYSQPPRPAGRGMEPRKSPVHIAAEQAGWTVLTPKSLKGAAEQATFAGHGADAAIVVAYGLLLPPPVLAAPRLGCFNLHASLLPRWRGAAPIQRAIMAGDPETGVMVMRMEAGLDTGPVCMTERVAIGPNETAGELHDRLAPLGARLMVRALAALKNGRLMEEPQPTAGVTYAAKIDKSEAQLDFTRSAAELHNLVRALSPFPGAWVEVAQGGQRERLKVLRSELAEATGSPGTVLDEALTIACGSGALRLTLVQRAGKRPMPTAELLRGFPLPPGTRLPQQLIKHP